MWHRCTGSRVPIRAVASCVGQCRTPVRHPPRHVRASQINTTESTPLYVLGAFHISTNQNLDRSKFIWYTQEAKKKKKNPNHLSIILQQQNHLLQQQNDFLQHQNHNLSESLQQMSRKNDCINGINLEEWVKKEWERLRETHM